MFRNSFYITLPSNASMKLYPDNTLSEYTTHLARRIVLAEDDWEVALTEIQYPILFSNVNSVDAWVAVEFKEPSGRRYLCTLPPGVYDRMEQILSHFNQVFKDELEFKYQDSVNRVQMTFGRTKFFSITMGPKLAVMMGFALPKDIEGLNDFAIYDEDIHEKSDTAELIRQIDHEMNSTEEEIQLSSVYPFVLQSEVPNQMYVYTDVIEPNFIGDSIAPLLRIVKIEHGTSDNHVATTFTNPYYIPVLKREFETIDINIRDDIGRTIPFLSGKLNVRLHFRRRQNEQFFQQTFSR